jgi:hypothetical protein
MVGGQLAAVAIGNGIGASPFCLQLIFYFLDQTLQSVCTLLDL